MIATLKTVLLILQYSGDRQRTTLAEVGGAAQTFYYNLFVS